MKVLEEEIDEMDEQNNIPNPLLGAPTAASPERLHTSDMDRIWKALRLVPEFDGNSHVLIRFLNICDQLVINYMNPAPGNELNNSALLNGILNKITGPAAKTLTTNGIPRDWNGIRNALINSFSDHRDESALYTDLSMLTQGYDTPHVFYERVQNLLSTVMTYVELHESIPTTIEAKRELYKKLGLQTYTRGLQEPLGSRIRCMRPETLEKALEYAQEELNVLYLQNKNTQPVNLKRHALSYPQSQHPFNFSPFNGWQANPAPKQFNLAPTPSYPTNQMIRPNFNYNPAQTVTNNRFPSSQLPNNQVSRTQQMMRALPRSNMTTGFRIPPRPQPQQPAVNYPRPMSGISYPVARPLPPTPQSQQQINTNETHDLEYYNLDYATDEYYDHYIDYHATDENETCDQSEQINFCTDPKETPPE